MNSTLYSSAQMLYGLSRFALVSRAFSALHPKYGTPARCIWFTAAFVVLTPFTGRLFFLPFINIASLATIVMWIMSLAAVLRYLRRARPDLRRPVRTMPGGRVTAVAGGGRLCFPGGQHPSPVQPRRAGRPGVRPGRRPGRPRGPPLRVPRPYPV
ncbi:MAG: amino acid permease [Flavonifractor plautii]